MRNILASHAIGHQSRDLKNALDRRPRINIQDNKGKAKVYQVRQVLQAIEKLEDICHEP